MRLLFNGLFVILVTVLAYVLGAVLGMLLWGDASVAHSTAILFGIASIVWLIFRRLAS